MTIQVAICADAGSIVLVSDTKVRSSEPVFSRDAQIDSVVHQRKVVFGSRHGVAVSMAGAGELGIDPARELAEHLSATDSLPGHLGDTLSKWADAFYCKHGRGGSDLPLCWLQVVYPMAEFSKLYTLRVAYKSSETGSCRYLVNGHDNSPAVFWLEWMKADEPSISLESATGIAITTVLTAGELNPYGIGGIEVHQFSSGLWKHWTLAECDNAIAQHKAQATKLKAAVASLGPPVPPPQP